MKIRTFPLRNAWYACILGFATSFSVHAALGVWPTPVAVAWGTASFPVSYHSVAQRALDGWTNVSSSLFQWLFNTNAGTTLVSNQYLDGSGRTLGVTQLTLDPLPARVPPGSPRKILLAQTIFDSSENWYVGTGSVPSGRIDFWSVAAHEFGHAAGLSHPPFTHICPGNSSNATMCPYISSGASYLRTLETWDKNRLSYLYSLPL